MKKMIMIAGIALAVGMVQASQILWGSYTTGSFIAANGLNTAGTAGTDGLNLGETVWLVYGTFSSTLELGDLTATVGSTVKGATILASSTIGTGIGSAPKKGRVNVTTSYTWGTGAGQYDTGDNLYIVAFDTDGATKYYGISGAYTLQAADETASPSFNVTGFSANTAVVPEPTSMALLALGVAAMGLRRKFRK